MHPTPQFFFYSDNDKVYYTYINYPVVMNLNRVRNESN